MASSDSSSTLQFATLAAVVVIGSCVAGYYFAGRMQHQPSTTPSAVQTAAPSTAASTADSAPSQTASAPDSTADYTAPNAPKIEIREEKAPPATAPPAKPAGNSQVATNPSDAEANQESDTTSDNSADTGTVGTVPSPVTGNATTPAASPQSADSDYEQTASNTDGEASQEGVSSTTNVRPRFRVQVGTFTEAMGARSLADALRTRGYSTTTVTDREGDKTVYHVQAGAYRLRSSADRATLELQRQGYPAFVTPMPD